MKRSLVLMMVIGLIFGSIATAEAGKKKKKKPAPQRVEQVVEMKYNGSNLGIASPPASGGTCFLDPTMPFACLYLNPPSADLPYLKLEVKDSAGQKAGGFISQQDADGDGFNDGYGEFCGAHPEPIALEIPGGQINVSLYNGFCPDASGPSIVTTGTIIATFSNMP